MSKIERYSPVIIPTLCRYKHLERCLKSLNNCTDAEYTDVYINVDYPTKDSHWDGYNKIKEFLTSFSYGFHSLNVAYNKENLGPRGNLSSLTEKLRGKYSTFILSEDDNEFSPNFLVFLNQNLEQYFDDESVFSVCGYNYNIDMSRCRDVSYASYEFSAWGAGYWFHKYDLLEKYKTTDYYRQILSTYSYIFKIYRKEPRLINTIMMLVGKNLVYGDTSIVCFQILNDKVSIFPTLSKVRNHGFDGSGTTIEKKNQSYENQKIDTDNTCQFKHISLTPQGDCIRLLQKYHSRKWWMNVGIIVRVLLYKWIKFDFVNCIPKKWQTKLLH